MDLKDQMHSTVASQVRAAGSLLPVSSMLLLILLILLLDLWKWFLSGAPGFVL